MLNPSEPHLIVYANLGEAALRSLLTIPINESDDDDLKRMLIWMQSC